MNVFDFQSDDLAVHPRSQLRIKFDNLKKPCTILAMSRIIFMHAMLFKCGMTIDLCMADADARFDDLDLDARSQWVGRGKVISVELSRQISKLQRRLFSI